MSSRRFYDHSPQVRLGLGRRHPNKRFILFKTLAHRNLPRFDIIYFRETKEIPGFSKIVSLGNEPEQEKTRQNRSKQLTALKRIASVAGAKRGGGGEKSVSCYKSQCFCIPPTNFHTNPITTSVNT